MERVGGGCIGLELRLEGLCFGGISFYHEIEGEVKERRTIQDAASSISSYDKVDQTCQAYVESRGACVQYLSFFDE